MRVSCAQIVATIGPATRDKDIVRELIKHQLDVARLNFSWGTHQEHAGYIKTVREVAKELERRVVIMADLPGPRIQSDKGHEFDSSVESLITKKDVEHLKFVIEQGVDYVVMSYVGSAQDISDIREKIKEFGGNTRVIAKVERKKAVDNIEEIIGVADAIMIGRGDLGNDVPVEQIPFIQKDIVVRANNANKPVIVATQMLISMVDNSEPTRAEVADISKAIVDGADAVMLSEETAIGKHPIDAVKVMERIVLEAEKQQGNCTKNKL